jgi:hypothetical protein
MAQTFLLDVDSTQIVLHYGTILTKAILEPSTTNHTLLAKVERNPDNPNILGLKNLSHQEWTVTFDDGEIRFIASCRTIKLEENLSIDFGNSAGTIRKINTRPIETILLDLARRSQNRPFQ